MDPIWCMGCQLWNYRFQTLWTPTPPSSQENALAELAISKKKQVRKKASPVLWQRRSSTEPTFVLEKKENVTTFECFFLSIDCIQPFFLARARCLSAGLRYLRLTRLPRHDRGPVSGGNRSAASCLCTVLRRALYHYATRSPSIDCIQPNLCRFLATGRDFGKFLWEIQW